MNSWTAVVAAPDQLGESPFWHPQERMLYWVDIPARQIRRVDPGTGEVQSWAVPMEPGCIAPMRGGGLAIALRDGIYCARSWGGPLRLVARFSHDIATTRFNDGKADPAGRFWAGTMYEPRDARKAELYSIDLRDSSAKPLIELKAHNAVIANGLAWSPDASTVYWADTPHHLIYAWDWDAHSNVMSKHRVFHEFPAKPAGWKPGELGYGGRPDGATVDAQGNYWAAMFEGQRLVKFSPAGQLLEEVALPVRCPTMPCFGGDDLKTLYVTSASYNRSEAELKELPLSGCVIATRVGVPGLPVNFVSD
ncbi:SMP-30/gluconolactonase/LRE family protein [Caenimonas soli]|uniref:SMP-30/gluconolactonase/LRE family protein n=1 Tax=Caenimonas soli TaxID=2735555 RepID=UPI001555FC62|nr:SMP-30/gluconolactonase/LRE family protein [Caenimonas soli]NPC55306.1 SMP-30/gluconolactonase/LRE family protein [Caenimonas soli]